MNELRNKQNRKLAGVLLGKLLELSRGYYSKLEATIRDKTNSYGLKEWKPFVESTSFRNLEHFLLKEEVIVKFEMDSSEKNAQKSNEGLNSLAKSYAEGVIAGLKKEEGDERSRPEWIHLNHLLDVVRLDKLMTKDFDFKHFYCEYGKYEMRELVELTKKNTAKL